RAGNRSEPAAAGAGKERGDDHTPQIRRGSEHASDETGRHQALAEIVRVAGHARHGPGKAGLLERAARQADIRTWSPQALQSPQLTPSYRHSNLVTNFYLRPSAHDLPFNFDNRAVWNDARPRSSIIPH